MVTKASHEKHPKVQAELSATLHTITAALDLHRWTAETPNKFVPAYCVEVRAIVLIMLFCGTRFKDLTYIRFSSLKQTQAYFEFLAQTKTRTELKRIRVHRFAETSSVCPYRALQSVLQQGAAKQLQLRNDTGATGAVFASEMGGAWSAAAIAGYASRVLKSIGVAWWRRPYKLKKLTASALVAAGVDRVDIKSSSATASPATISTRTMSTTIWAEAWRVSSTRSRQPYRSKSVLYGAVVCLILSVYRYLCMPDAPNWLFR